MIIYLILLALSITIFWAYFKLVLKSNTHFNLIRHYFLFALICSLLIPFMDQLQLDTFQLDHDIFKYSVSTLDKQVLNSVAEIKSDVKASSQSENSPLSWVINIYIIGVLALFFRSLIATLSIFRIKYSSKKERIKGVTVFFNDQISQPFSLFQSVYLPMHWQGAVPDEVIDHEKIHIIQFHFVDLLLSEFISMLLWFYPIAHLLKKDLRANLEFIADEEVINKGYNVCHYQSLLLSVVSGENFQPPLKMYFNVPLKNRITMMTKRKTGLISKMSLLGVLPITALLVAFNVNKTAKEPIENLAKPLTVIVQDENKPELLPLDQTKELKATSEFGMAMHPILKLEKMHKGIDLRANVGDPVYATSAGTIEIASFDDNHGFNILIKHSEVYQSRYSHLQRYVVEANAFVKKGQIIGYAGSTGQSTGPHLHFEIIKDGEHVNPRSIIKALDDC